MDPIEIEDWLRGVRSTQMQPITLRTSDAEELRSFKTGLPADYRWVEPDEALLGYHYTCKFCGAPSQLDPADQEMPPDYCHPEDHMSEV